MSIKSIVFTLFTLLIIFSCQKKKEIGLLAIHIPENNVRVDSSIITIPLNIQFGEVSEKYKQTKSIALKNFYDKNINTDDYSGSFLVAKNGHILYEKYNGYSNYKEKEAITKTTPLHIASVSKVLTATLILKLVSENQLSLDQKVQTILPDFPYVNTSVRSLLNHRSGLPNYARFGETIKGWNTKKIVSNQNIVDLLVKHKMQLLSKEDTHFNYCNTNYVVLALVIEKITNQKYADAMQSMVFEPLGMNNSFVLDFSEDKNKVSQSYKSLYQLHAWDQFDALYGDKNIYTTPRDLLKFDLATYSEEFIPKSILDEAFKGYSYEKKGEKNYGLGIRLREWETGQKLFYHNGWWHGNTSSYVTLKRDTVTIIAFSNKYTQKTYKSMRISALFGDFPFELEKENE